MKISCPFGSLLREERNKKGIPLWRLAARIPFPASNLHRIETGVTEPRISLAMRILSVLKVDAGNFARTLAETQEYPKYEIPAGFTGKRIDLFWQNWFEGSNFGPDDKKALFGLYFRKIRIFLGLTQNEIAKRAAYTTRSLILVEKGQQEPMVMRALQLAHVMGIDVKAFFENYAEILNLGV